jgi:hypothetical protein
MFACVKHYKSISDNKRYADFIEGFSFVLGVVCGLARIIVHVGNLDTEHAARSLAMAFLGVNASFLYVYSVVEPTEWLKWAPLILMIGMMGLVAGLLSYDRDPQADIKAKAKREKLVEEQKRR